MQDHFVDMVDYHRFDGIGTEGTLQCFQLDGHTVVVNHIELGFEEDIRSEDEDYNVFYTVQQEMSHNEEQTEDIHSLD